MNPTETLEKIRTELVRKHGLAENSLTEHQLAQVIRDALASGDIQRHVRFDGVSQSQMVTYIPYFGVESLRSENARLKQRIVELEAERNA
jgi:hypothetical protein